MSDKGMIGFYILEILDEHSSKERKLMQSDILTYLKKDYNIMVTRNTLSKYLKELRAKGRVTGARGVYSVREFSNNEIAIMLNSVTAVKAVPNAEIQNIVKKLRSMAEPEERGKFCETWMHEFLYETEKVMNSYTVFLIQRNKKRPATQVFYTATAVPNTMGNFDKSLFELSNVKS